MKLNRNTIQKLLFTLTLSTLFSCGGKQIELYVSPNGNDTDNGSINSPLKTIEAAKKLLAKKKSEQPDKAAIIYIRGGEYLIEETIAFDSTSMSSEKSPITIQAYKNEQPVFVGSRKLTKWAVLDDAKILNRLQESARGKVYVTNIKEAGITNFGDPIQLGERPELYCDNALQPLSRWPNKEYILTGKEKGTTDTGPNYLNRKGKMEGIFEYFDNYQDRWAEENEACLSGYWFWDWSEDYQKIDKIDTRSKTIYLKQPFHRYGFRIGAQYYGLNLLCEIDSPGEWFLDRQTGLLYWFPPQGVDPNTANVVVTNFAEPFMLKLQGCSHITVEGLSFVEGRGSAISIEGGTNNRILNCRIERFGRDGIHVNGGSNHSVSGCYISTLGCRGIDIAGGDRKTLTPSGHVVENTVVTNFSLFKRTYEPAIHMDGCGIRIANNQFSYSTSSAIRLEGNDHIIEYNQIRFVVDESDDQGGLDVYYDPSYQGNIIRYNHWSDISGGTMHGAAGVRLDDMISGMQIYGNLFERCGVLDFGGVQINGGKDNVIDNNIFFKCHAAVSFSLWDDIRWHQTMARPAVQEKLYKTVDINSEIYKTRYPQLQNLNENINSNTIKNNLIISCDKPYKDLDNRQIVENNTELKAEDKTIFDFCKTDVLAKYGLKPIPVDSIGPKNNKWMTK